MKEKMKMMKSFRTGIVIILSILVSSVMLNSCIEEDIPEAGSLPDENPPEAGFAFSQGTDPLTINFSNQSASATIYEWDFGDGNTSTEKDPSNTYGDYGTYTVNLVAKDNLGASSTITQDLEIVEGPYQPFLLEPGFEDNMLPDGTGDGRDSWRNSDLGGVIQITGSPVRTETGSQGAKLPGLTNDQRIGYQLFTVEADMNYDVNFYYTMLDDQPGFLTVSILSGPVTTHEEALAATIGSVTVNDQEDPDTYEPAKVSFSSGSSTEVAIYFFNLGTVETRLDDFTIDIAPEGAVPPSAAFTYEQSETNFLEYTFTNSSVNATSYTWDFGDGNTSTEESPTHVYAAADVYTVMLTANNDAGLSGEFSTDIDIQDPVFPGFTYEVDADNYLKYQFTNTSTNDVSVEWDFGDGYSASVENPMHIYDEDGTYTVTLTATSSTGLTEEVSENITVALGFVPIILEPSFEDGQLDGGTGDGRDSWRVSGGNRPDGMGGVIQITSSPVKTGSQAAKFPTSNERAAYQEIAVEQNTDYTVTFWYTMKDSPAGSLTVAILDGPVSDPANVAGATIASTTVNDQTDPNTYIEETVSFNSGSSGTIVIYITNTDVEARVDDVSIQ